MFEDLGFETLTAPQAAIWLGLGLGLLYGILAERSGFCFRRAVVGDDRRSAAGVWLTALVVALLGTQAVVGAGLVDFADHRFLASNLPALAIVIGGLAFGAGMVLTRGCVSRLTVLAGGGNLRAVLVLLVFAVTAHATLKGILAPLRTSLGAVTLDVGPLASLGALPGGPLVWTGLIAAASLSVIARSGAAPRLLALAVAIGALVPLGWAGTGFVLYDDFDPVALESLSFTSPFAESLFWVIASSAIPAGFGSGLVGGVLAGGLAAALVFGSFRWQSFETPAQTGRYVAGGALMGVGGVLAGGCTIGAGLSGLPTLSLAAVLAILSIGAGARVTARALGELSAAPSGSASPAATPATLPAE